MAWDSTMRGKGEHRTDAEMAHIVFSRFEQKDTKAGIKFSLGGLYVPRFVKYVSQDAYRRILEFCPEAVVEGCGIDHTKLKPKIAKVTFEHVVPIAAAYQYLNDRNKRKVLTEQDIVELMPKLFLAIITKEENKKLVKAELNSKMPNGWWDSARRDPFDRYRQAGLGDEIWRKCF